jgi:hypothetical protein
MERTTERWAILSVYRDVTLVLPLLYSWQSEIYADNTVDIVVAGLGDEQGTSVGSVDSTKLMAEERR